ncbi:hypothetical protein [Mucilaginibacter celer]|uniref:Outer membrane protein beta-barrel domain-containing protein n=1 Tax=Mucilaginibacter celer TaxID=2305508 RepID=A0A494W0V2_9SPHI|nr:hypothetical protein [Mucilaginibacter celer]AYL97168.1 hypothetical protein HYN43_018465 [Mucilaginibacter celer]
MNKISCILLTTLFMACGIVARAQKGNQTSIIIGTELNIPVNINDYPQSGPDVHYWGGYGINAKLEKPISSSLHFTAGLGVVIFQTNPNDLFGSVNPDNSTGFYYTDDYHTLYAYLPLTAGLKYYVSKYFYLSGEAGSAFKISNRTNTSFIYSGGGGAVVPIGPHHGFDFNLRYERGYKNVDYNFVIQSIGINVAYKYRF